MPFGCVKSFRCIQRLSIALLLMAGVLLLYVGFSTTRSIKENLPAAQERTEKLLPIRHNKTEENKTTAYITTSSQGIKQGSKTRKIVKDEQSLKVERTRWVRNSHKNSSLLLGKWENNDNVKHCDMWSKYLLGRMKVTPLSTVKEVTDKKALENVMVGGTYTPRDCIAREKVAIIIPYRDRAIHLETLVNHLHAVLQRQQLEYAIFVIEMSYPTQFNRGLLANVGYLTAHSIKEYTCYVIHDVDLLVRDDRNIYRCGHVPRHLVASSSAFKDNIPYLSYFGGVNAFTKEQFLTVNGFSNLFFGRGGEDDDMVSRIIHSGLHFSRPKRVIGGFVALERGHNDVNPPNPHRLSLRMSSGRRRQIEGVETVKYTRLALEYKSLYTWVLVSVKEADILSKYQDFLNIPVDVKTPA